MPARAIRDLVHVEMSFPPSGAVERPYRGRFAPTPNGPLHLGSLLTALASFLEARRQRGAWLLRFDDLDSERCAPGIDTQILRQLEAHGLDWDEVPRYESRHVDEYLARLDSLRKAGLVYACACTRARIKADSLRGIDGPIYAGTCAARALPEGGHALRLRVGERTLSFVDGWQGLQHRNSRDLGDILLRRRDGIIAYQLACSVDEHAQGITEVVRGMDLLPSTFSQLLLMDMLELARPAYRHLPVLTDASGRKLSKQNHAPALQAADASGNLHRCLGWLGQRPPAELRGASVRELIGWALADWHPDRLAVEMRPEVERPV